MSLFTRVCANFAGAIPASGTSSTCGSRYEPGRSGAEKSGRGGAAGACYKRAGRAACSPRATCSAATGSAWTTRSSRTARSARRECSGYAEPCTGWRAESRRSCSYESLASCLGESRSATDRIPGQQLVDRQVPQGRSNHVADFDYIDRRAHRGDRANLLVDCPLVPTRSETY